MKNVRRDQSGEDWYPSRMTEAIEWEQMPAPLPVPPIDPDQVIRDIVEATLNRVKKNAAIEISEAAARCLNLLNGKQA